MQTQPQTPGAEAHSVDLKLKGFKVYAVDLPASRIRPYVRRDFLVIQKQKAKAVEADVKNWLQTLKL